MRNLTWLCSYSGLMLVDPSKQRVRSRTSHKRHNSAPLPSKAPQQPQENNEDPASPSSEQATAPNSAPAAEPVGVSASPPAAAPEAPAEATDGSNNVNDDPPQPAEPSAPDPAQYKLTNPLPAVPQSTLETDPYRSVRRTQNSGLPGVSGHYAAPIASVTYKPHLRSQYRPSKGKDPVLKPPRPHEELIREVRSGNTGKGPFMRLRSFTMPSLSGMMGKKSSRSPIPTHSISYPYPYATVPGSRGPMPASPISLSPPVSAGPPIIIPLHSSLNPTSLHKILYKKKLYPTAAHLFEAHKYLKQRPELSERIRTSSSNAAEMDALSKAFELDGFVRYDWSVVWRDKVRVQHLPNDFSHSFFHITHFSLITDQTV